MISTRVAHGAALFSWPLPGASFLRAFLATASPKKKLCVLAPLRELFPQVASHWMDSDSKNTNLIYGQNLPRIFLDTAIQTWLSSFQPRGASWGLSKENPNLFNATRRPVIEKAVLF
jgi:hypothetical protein